LVAGEFLDIARVFWLGNSECSGWVAWVAKWQGVGKMVQCCINEIIFEITH